MPLDLPMNGMGGRSNRKNGRAFQRSRRQMQADKENPSKRMEKTNSGFADWYALLASRAGKTGRIALR